MAKFNVLGINHLGLAAKDAAKCAWFLEEVLGLQNLGSELVAPQKTMTQMFAANHSTHSYFPSRLEILSPQDGTSDGPISKYLEKKGGGIHHLAIAVDDVKAAIKHLQNKGVRLIDDAPRPGAHHTLIAFVHPESAGGILVELVQQAVSG